MRQGQRRIRDLWLGDMMWTRRSRTRGWDHFGNDWVRLYKARQASNVSGSLLLQGIALSHESSLASWRLVDISPSCKRPISRRVNVVVLLQGMDIRTRTVYGMPNRTFKLGSLFTQFAFFSTLFEEKLSQLLRLWKKLSTLFRVFRRLGV